MSRSKKTATAKTTTEANTRKTTRSSTARKTSAESQEAAMSAVEAIAPQVSAIPVPPTDVVPEPESFATESDSAKPVAKKTAARPRSGTKAVETVKPAVSPEQRRHYIEVAAYYIAERRGFTEGDPLADWAEAEREIDDLLRRGSLP